MPILNSQINPHSPAFQENADALRVQVAELKELLTEVVKGGGEVAVARHKGRGKLTARERINALLDEGSPFLVRFKSRIYYSLILVSCSPLWA